MIPTRCARRRSLGSLRVLAAVLPVKAAEPARLVVTLNCDDIHAIAQWKGWGELERRARAAGATEQQIEDALRCLATAR
jgi:hypothetical protein